MSSLRKISFQQKPESTWEGGGRQRQKREPSRLESDIRGTRVGIIRVCVWRKLVGRNTVRLVRSH